MDRDTSVSQVTTEASQGGHRWRLVAILVATLLLIVAQPLIADVCASDGSFDIFFSLLIVALLLRVFDEREHRRIAVLLGVLAFVGIVLGHATDGTVSRYLLVGAHVVAAAFFAFSLYGILRTIFVSRVSSNALFGAVCGYLLLGIIWGLLFAAVETAAPGSFRSTASPPSTRSEEDRSAEPVCRDDLNYFSFVTLATVGYGDIVPITPLARTLAWTEAIAGQFYLAVLVAGLVGFKVTQSMNNHSVESEKRPGS